MTEDNLYPHSDEAGRVPGAVHVDRAQDGADTIAWSIFNAGVHNSRKEERNRLVWEAMKAYMTYDDLNALDRAVRIVDEYLAWRDRDE